MTADAPRADRRALLVFALLVVALGWLAALPLYLAGSGLQHPAAGPILIGMMWTPTAAAVLLDVVRCVPLRNAARRNGLALGRRNVGVWLFAWTVPGLLVALAPLFSALFGVYPLDLTFSGFRALLEQSGVNLPPAIAPQTIVVAQLVQALLLGPLLNLPAVFGEEYGWRGWLLPRLLPFGQWPALMLSGALWGLWHAPVILLGYNYPTAPQLGVLLMIGFCVLSGIVLGWTRLRTGSIWPAVIAHGSINAFGGSLLVFAAADMPVNTVLAGGLGLTGWLLWLMLIAVLFFSGQLPVRTVPDAAIDAA